MVNRAQVYHQVHIYPLVLSVSHPSHSPVPFFPILEPSAPQPLHISVLESVVLSLYLGRCLVAGQVVLEFSSCVFLYRFHKIFTSVTNFAHIVLVLFSNSEPILKTGIVFVYELGFRRSIYQNRSEKNFGSVHPSLCWGRNFLFWPKTGHKILFSWSQAFCQF